MSEEALQTFKELLQQVVLSPSEPDFEEKAERVLRVWRELHEALNGGEVSTSQEV